MSKHPIRSAALTQCLKSHKFVKEGSYGCDGVVWQHKDDDNLTVCVYADSVAMEIFGFAEIMLEFGNRDKLIENTIAEINRRMELNNKRLEQFHALLAEITHWCKSCGVPGKFIQNKVSSENFEFRCKPFQDSLFVMAFRGQESFVLDIDFNERSVGTLDDVTKRLLGFQFQDWPSDQDEYVIKGKSLFVNNSLECWMPFVYRYGGVSSLKEYNREVKLVSDDPVLAQLMTGSETISRSYYELKFRQKINEQNFMNVLVNKGEEPATTEGTTVEN